MLKQLVDHYRKNEKVAFVALQTVFEGFQVNTAAKLMPVARKFSLKIPFGHDPGSDGRRSNVLQRYRTRGTPWFIIMDPRGIVRWNGFLIEKDAAVKLIDGLVGKGAGGSSLPDLGAVQWAGASGGRPKLAGARLTLVRFSTAAGEDAATSLKALGALRRRFRGRGMRVLVLHPQRPQPDLGALRSKTRKLGYSGPLGWDADGRVEKGLREAGVATVSGVTLVVDPRDALVEAFPSPRLALRRRDREGWKAYSELVERIKKHLAR